VAHDRTPDVGTDDVLHALVEQLPVTVYVITDTEPADALYISGNIEAMLGYDADAFITDPLAYEQAIHPDDLEGVLVAWGEARRSRVRFERDYRLQTPDGRTIHVRDSAIPVPADGGDVRWHGVLWDVTAERVLEAQRRATDGRFRALVDQLPAAVYEESAGPNVRTRYVSPDIERLTGYPADAFLQDPDLWSSLIVDDGVSEGWDAGYAGTEPLEMEYRILDVEGRTRWVHDRAVPIVEDGRVVAWQGVIFDTTRTHEVEDALRISEAQHRSLIEQLPAVVYIDSDDPEPSTIFLSASVEELLGLPPSAFDGKDELRWLETLHPDDRERVSEAWLGHQAAGTPFDDEYRLLRADGSFVWVHDHCALIRDADGRRLHWQGVLVDITDRVEAERAAAVTERRVQALVERLPVVVFAVSDDLVPEVLYSSPNSLDVLGHSDEELMSQKAPFPSYVHEDDRVAAWLAWEQAFRTRTRYDAEYRVVKRDGGVVWIRDNCALVEDEEGGWFWQGVSIDITEEKAAEQAMRSSEARYRTLIENVPAVVYEMGPDDERQTLYVSSRIEGLLGYSRQEWLDQPDIWIELLHPDDRETELAAHDLHTHTGTPWAREYRLIAEDGRVVWVRDQATLVYDDEGQPHRWQGVMLDITAQKMAEERLRTMNEELEERVRARTAQLQEANEFMGLEIAERRRAERDLAMAEQRFQHLVEVSPAVVYTWQVGVDPNGKDLAYISPQIETLLGYTTPEWHDGWGTWRNRLHPHDRDRVTALALQSEETGEPFEAEYRYLAKDGRVVWVLDRATMSARDDEGKPLLFHGVMVDISTVKEAVARATEESEQLRELMSEGPVGAYAYELDSVDPLQVRVIHSGMQVGHILGYPTSEWTATPARWQELIHPDDRSRVAEEAIHMWRTGEPLDRRYRMIAADGRVVWIEDHARCVARADDGTPRRFVGAILDVTAQAERDEAERARADTVDAVVRTAPVMLWTESVEPSTGRSRSLYVSEGSRRILGYAPEEFLLEAEHQPSTVHPDDVERIRSSSILADLGEAGVWEEIYRVVHRDGSVRTVHAQAHRATLLGVEPAIWHGVTVEVVQDRVIRTVDPAQDPAQTAR
jgi:PAS domain S-box-containing protein